MIPRSKSTQAGSRFRAILERSTNNLWGCHFPVPGATVKRLLAGGSRRVVCTLNEATSYQCALIPFGNGTFVITVNKSLRSKLGVDIGSEVRVHLTSDTSTYGLPMPGELAELLRQDREGRRFFSALTDGRKRTLLYIVGKAKDSEQRIARALAVVQHLKANKGVINYRQLSMALRNHPRNVSSRP